MKKSGRKAAENQSPAEPSEVSDSQCDAAGEQCAAGDGAGDEQPAPEDTEYSEECQNT